LLHPVIPIKAGVNGPPLLKGWQEASEAELEEILERNPQCNRGMRLDHYLVLDPDNQEAIEYLDRLEQESLLPITWTWITWRGRKARVYSRQEGLQYFQIKEKDGINLEIRTGSGHYCVTPDSRVNDGTYKWAPGLSPADVSLADLPEATLELLKRRALSKNIPVVEQEVQSMPKPAVVPAEPTEQIRLIMSRCEFLQHCDRDRAALSEPEWFTMITQFCGLPGGEQWIHQLSQGYPKYSAEETDKKIDHARDGSPGAHSCSLIKQLYDCHRDCGVTAPARLGNPEKPAHHFSLVSVNDLVLQPQPDTSWLWDGILIQGGLSLSVAKPKVGKSTLAQNMAVAVSRGADFLGRATVQVPVIYLALEEKGSELQKRLIALGAKDEPLYLHIGLAPADGLKEIDALLAQYGAGLLIIDTMQKLVRIRDLNDYAQVTNALEPILGVARERNCHIMLIHHAGKAERKDGDEILGSTAILGAVDTAIILKKRDQARTFSTIQRYGEDVPETLLLLNSDYSLTVGGTLEETKEKETWDKICTVIEALPEITEPEIIDRVEGRGADKAKVLRWALNQTPPLVQRHGARKKGDPYRYFLPPMSPAPIREGEKPKTGSAATSDDCKQNTPSQILQAIPLPGRGEDLTRLNPECSDHRLEAWDKAIGGMVSDGIVRQGNVRWLYLQRGGYIQLELPDSEVSVASQDHPIYKDLEGPQMIH
jgi:hypothetical protein